MGAALLIVGREHLRPGRPVGEEYVKKAARHRAEAELARVVPYDFDNEEKLDPMALLEEAIRHCYWKAKIEELGRFCDFRIVDNAIQNAARIAREIVSFRHPKNQCRKAGCSGSECRVIAWRHDSGRDA